MSRRLSMDRMREGERARVERNEAREEIRGRLRDLGLIEGTVVRCLHRKASGSMAAYQIRGAVIALRQEDPGRVLVSLSGTPVRE